MTTDRDVAAAVTSATRSALGSDDVSTDLSFVDQGGDSLTAIAFAVTLSDELGIAVPLELIFDAPDLDDLAATLARRVESVGQPSI